MSTPLSLSGIGNSSHIFSLVVDIPKVGGEPTDKRDLLKTNSTSTSLAASPVLNGQEAGSGSGIRGFISRVGNWFASRENTTLANVPSPEFYRSLIQETRELIQQRERELMSVLKEKIKGVRSTNTHHATQIQGIINDNPSFFSPEEIEIHNARIQTILGCQDSEVDACTSMEQINNLVKGYFLKAQVLHGPLKTKVTNETTPRCTARSELCRILAAYSTSLNEHRRIIQNEPPAEDAAPRHTHDDVSVSMRYALLEDARRTLDTLITAEHQAAGSASGSPAGSPNGTPRRDQPSTP